MELTFTRPAASQVNPWDAPGTPTTYTLTAIDQGIRQVYVDGNATESTARTSATRFVRTLMVDALGTAPQIGDRVSIGGQSHDVLRVLPLAPGGVAIYYKVEVST
jgi:hypothetical protein